MAEGGARRLISRATRRLRRALGNGAQRTPASPDGHDVAYPWLNEVLVRLLAEGGHAMRPSYTWGVLHAVHLAKSLGLPRVSVLELGVAGGNGLLALEEAAARVERVLGVAVDAYGFDTGSGLPPPRDYRDLPNLYQSAAYPMDVDALRARLRRAQLVLGPVEHTVGEFIAARPAPIAFVAFDLDYYSSTIAALRLLEAPDVLLPRVHCYFDDIMGYTFSEFTGVRLAISEFNVRHERRKISPIFGLRYYLPEGQRQALWPEKCYLLHVFDHPAYAASDGLVRRTAPTFTALAKA